MKKAVYKNSLKTKQNIKIACLTLMKDKDISQIRVKQILELADISKGTFYAHYKDVYNILEEIENENIERMTMFFNDIITESLIDDFSPFIRKIFEQMGREKEFFTILLNSTNASSFLNKLQKVFVDYMVNDKELLKIVVSDDEALMYFTFISSGTVNLVKEWFTNKYTCSLDELANQLNQFIIKGIDAIRIRESIWFITS